MKFTTENTLSSTSKKVYGTMAILLVSNIRSNDKASLHRAMQLNCLLEKLRIQYNQNEESNYNETKADIDALLEREEFHLKPRPFNY